MRIFSVWPKSSLRKIRHRYAEDRPESTQGSASKAWAACATIIISKQIRPPGLSRCPWPTAKLYQTLAHHFEEQDPKLFKPVQLTYKIKKPQPATPKQLALLSNLIRKTKAEVTWDTKTLTRSEASRIIERLLKNRT